MPQPQPGIIPEPSPNALFLILRVREPATNGSAVAKVAAGVPALVNKLGAIDPRAKLVCTVSFGEVMDEVHGFQLMDYTRAVSGATFFAPSLEVLKSLGSRSGR